MSAMIAMRTAMPLLTVVETVPVRELGPFATDIAKHWDMDVVGPKVEKYALGRIGQPDEIVGAALYFASDASRFTTGTIVRVDGGMGIA